ncbi:hypothetical protein V5N11_020433 [Cardamine amara subsp. amara]|uniref:TFIIS N-terminal domain-containing protein n=1 Tax=Cardamine amara subsp. amara TaxID=228776 RepID=A0ABD1ARZ6_CARAN
MKIANATERSDLHHRLVYSAVKASNSENVSVLMKKNPLQSKEKTEFLGLKKNQDQRSKTHGVATTPMIQNLNKDDSFATTKPMIQTKKQPVKNPRSRAHKLGVVIKQNLKKSGVYKSVRQTSRPLQQMKKQPSSKKNMAEMLELFDIAKKSADVANAKGILAAKEETCICVETLSLLISYPISSTAKETRLVMDKLHRLTKHKDRKICNYASNLHQHWTLSIRDQQP